MHIPAYHPTATPFTASSNGAAVNIGKANARSYSSGAAGASSDSSTSTSSPSTASITANDFLQLLVTEMKNQDPTATTDPNEYINQLVQVNSLEQLIQINQDLSGLGSGSSGASNSAGSTGNLSVNTAKHSNMAAAADQVANAMETTHNASARNATTHLSIHRSPSTLLHGIGLR